MPFDRLKIAAEAARRDDGALEFGVDVEDRRERPVDTRGAALKCHRGTDRRCRLNVVDGGERQWVGKLSAAGEAHAAPLQIGRHQ